LAVLNLMLPAMPDGMVDNIEAFTQGLFTLATDTDSGVRKQVGGGAMLCVGGRWGLGDRVGVGGWGV